MANFTSELGAQHEETKLWVGVYQFKRKPGYLRKDGADTAKRLLDQLPDGPGVVTPLNGIRSGEHYRRCDEMAGWVRGMVGYDRRAAVDQTNIAAWFAYMAGSTSERPW